MIPYLLMGQVPTLIQSKQVFEEAKKGNLEAQFELFQITKNYDFQIADSVLYVIEEEVNESNLDNEASAKLYQAKAEMAFNHNEYDQMRQFIQQCLELTEDSFLLIKTYRDFGLMEYNLSNYERSIPLLNKSLAISKNRADSVNLTRLYGSIAENYIHGWSLDSARLYIDSAQLTIPHHHDDFQDLLNEIRLIQNWHIYKSSNLQGALDSTLLLSDECVDLGQENLAIRCEALVAQVYYHLGNYEEAEKSYDKMLAFSRANFNRVQELKQLDNLAYAFRMKGDFSKSIELSKLRLTVADSLDSEWHKGYSYIRLYQVYLDNNQTDLQIEMIDKAMAIFRRLENKNGIAEAYNSYGNTYESTGDFVEALSAYQQCFEIKKSNPKSHWVIPLYNIGNILVKLTRYEESIGYFQQSLEICEEQFIIGMKIRNLAGIAEVRLNLKDYSEAQKLIGEALPLVIKTQYQRMKRDVFELASKIYAASGKYQKALHFHQLFKIQNDSLFNEASDRRYAAMEIQFQTLEKEQENELLRKDVQLKDAGLKNQRQWTLIAIVILIFTMIAGGLIYRNNRMLNQKNLQIESQGKSIQKRNHQIETLLKEVHHRVKNNLQVITSLLEIDDLGDDPVAAAIILEDSKSRVATMSLIHQKLYMHDDLDLIPLEEYIIDLVSSVSEIHLLDEEPELHVGCGNLAFDVDTMVPLGLAINELVTNCFKYAFIGNNLYLKITCQQTGEGKYQIQVRDKGDNLPKPLAELIQTGYGLKLAYRLSNQLLGELSHHYTEGNVFTIDFYDSEARRKVE